MSTKACRRWIASLLALVLLCLQLTTAAYACPAPAGARPDMADCTQMTAPDAASPQLCKAHCERDRQTVNSHAVVPDLPAAASVDHLLTRLALWLVPVAAEALPAVIAAHSGPPGGAPPRYLALLVLRH